MSCINKEKSKREKDKVSTDRATPMLMLGWSHNSEQLHGCMWRVPQKFYFCPKLPPSEAKKMYFHFYYPPKEKKNLQY